MGAKEVESGKVSEKARQKIPTDFRLVQSAHIYLRDTYKFYLKGKFYWDQWNPHSVRKALKCFRDAIVLNPSCVEAYAGLANCYSYLGITGNMAPWIAFQKAERVVKEAVKIDAENGAVLAARGLVETFYHRDYQQANEVFKQAFQVKEDPDFYHLYSLCLTVVGKVQAAVAMAGRSVQLEPDSVLFSDRLAQSYYYNRQYTEALEQYQFTLDLEPSFTAAITGKGWTQLALGEVKQAHHSFENYQNIVQHVQENVPQLVYIAAIQGMDKVALHFLDRIQLVEEESVSQVTSLDIASVYLALKRYDDAFFHLQAAVNDYLGQAGFLKVDPLWDPIKSDLRYQKLLQQMNAIHSEFFIPALEP